jgi:hypothetical protein
MQFFFGNLIYGDQNFDLLQPKHMESGKAGARYREKHHRDRNGKEH